MLRPASRFVDTATATPNQGSSAIATIAVPIMSRKSGALSRADAALPKRLRPRQTSITTQRDVTHHQRGDHRRRGRTQVVQHVRGEREGRRERDHHPTWRLAEPSAHASPSPLVHSSFVFAECGHDIGEKLRVDPRSSRSKDVVHRRASHPRRSGSQPPALAEPRDACSELVVGDGACFNSERVERCDQLVERLGLAAGYCPLGHSPNYPIWKNHGSAVTDRALPKNLWRIRRLPPSPHGDRGAIAVGGRRTVRGPRSWRPGGDRAGRPTRGGELTTVSTTSSSSAGGRRDPRHLV